jgi:hypothetical protein
MTIKKVTVADLRNIQGGEAQKGNGKVKRGEKIAIKEIGAEASKDVDAKNKDKKSADKAPSVQNIKLP